MKHLSEITHLELVAALVKPGDAILKDLTYEKAHLWHMASCIPGEAGELFDGIKKHVIYNKELDRENVIEELGDLEFYLEGLRAALGITREETLAANIVKLSKRYVGLTYSDGAAQERKDKQEKNDLTILRRILKEGLAISADKRKGLRYFDGLTSNDPAILPWGWIREQAGRFSHYKINREGIQVALTADLKDLEMSGEIVIVDPTTAYSKFGVRCVLVIVTPKVS